MDIVIQALRDALDSYERREWNHNADLAAVALAAYQELIAAAEGVLRDLVDGVAGEPVGRLRAALKAIEEEQ